MSNRVAVTGMAIWSPFGRGLDAFWEGLKGERPGRTPVRRFDASHWIYRARTAAAIPELDGEDPSRADQLVAQVMSSVVKDVLTAARIEAPDISPYDTALSLGCSQSTTTRFQDYLRARRQAADLPESLLQSQAWLSSGSLLTEAARQLNARGPALMISTACASGTSSIGAAYNMIRQGRARRAFAGGVGYFSEISFSGFNILRLTGREGCKPFDVERDGMMLGDGFALVTLEEESLARERGAPVHAWIVGYGSANEAFHATSPDPSGGAAFRVMWEALGKSAQNLARLDYINAHGTGTVVNDTAELVAIQRLLQLRGDNGKVAISSTKGAHGHSLGAAGSVEFIATLLAMQHGMVLPTLGLEKTDPAFDGLDLVRHRARPQPVRLALSNSFAFGGNVAAIAVEAPEGPAEKIQGEFLQRF